MVNLPSGTVTFVFSDIAGSTRHLKRLGDADYASLLAVHRRLVREIFAAHDGQETDTQGDAFFYSFVRARQAVAAAVEVQRAHLKASWPGDADVRVRLGLHTGEPTVGDEGYTGLDVVRASRIAALGGEGAALLSGTTRAIVAGDLPAGTTLSELGERQLKDIDRPEPLWQLVIDGEAAAPVQPASQPDTEAPAHARRGGRASAFRDLGDRVLETIESRVLSELDASLSNDSPGPPTPRQRPLTREIARLHELRRSGALTDDQYQRAVDRLLEADSTPVHLGRPVPPGHSPGAAARRAAWSPSIVLAAGQAPGVAELATSHLGLRRAPAYRSGGCIGQAMAVHAWRGYSSHAQARFLAAPPLWWVDRPMIGGYTHPQDEPPEG